MRAPASSPLLDSAVVSAEQDDGQSSKASGFHSVDGTYNFGYLDEQTKRMIRRALLKAVAVPGYQVPFGGREMPLPYGWGTGGIQVTVIHQVFGQLAFALLTQHRYAADGRYIGGKVAPRR